MVATRCLIVLGAELLTGMEVRFRQVGPCARLYPNTTATLCSLS